MRVDDEEGMELGEATRCIFGDGRRSCKCLFNGLDSCILGEPILFFLRWPLKSPGESIRSYKELMVGRKGVVGLWGDYNTWY